MDDDDDIVECPTQLICSSDIYIAGHSAYDDSDEGHNFDIDGYDN